MTTGDIVIVSFPYTDLVSFKARPAVIVNIAEDNFNDVIICLITSVVPVTLNKFQLLLSPDNFNNLKTTSVVKIFRIATVEHNKIRAIIGRLNQQQLVEFKFKFKSLVDDIK